MGPRTRRTASTTTSSGAPRPSTPMRRGPRRRAGTQVEVEPGATIELRLRLRPTGGLAQSGGVGVGEELRQGHGRPDGRGRRLLRRAHAGPGERRRGRRHAAGVRRHALVQAAVQLRRRPLARRGSDPTDAPRLAADRAEQPMAQLRRLRHHVDAGQVGVPVVRGLGPGVPLRRAGPRRPRVRQVPAHPDLPRVVSAPQRRAAGLRVVVRRRQPAGAGLGCPRGVRHRRRARRRLPPAGVRQAAGQLHVVGQPGGSQRQQPVRRWLPRARQHRPDRP